MKVVVLKSMSYTGTTWINFVLANQPDAFYLGPPDRIWRLPPEQYPHACLLHRAGTCPYWTEFFADYEPRERFLPQLADRIGGRRIILANPTPDFTKRELDRDDVDQRLVFVVRDGRAVTHSLLRHLPNQFASFEEAVRTWLLPAMRVIHGAYTSQRDRSRWFRYEQMIQDPKAALKSLGEFIGLDYGLDALRYWEREVHPTAGNIGTIDVIARMQGAPDISH